MAELKIFAVTLLMPVTYFSVVYSLLTGRYFEWAY